MPRIPVMSGDRDSAAKRRRKRLTRYNQTSHTDDAGLPLSRRFVDLGSNITAPTVAELDYYRHRRATTEWGSGTDYPHDRLPRSWEWPE